MKRAPRRSRIALSARVLPAVLLVSAAGCGGPPAPAAVLEGPPGITLPAGSRYFSDHGVSRPLLMRNIAGSSVAQMATFFDSASQAGTRIVRIQLTQGIGFNGLGMHSDGSLDEAWAARWDQVFDAAAVHGLAVIPIFAIWGDWNDGTPDLGWVNWTNNPLNPALGGPATGPGDLFVDGGPIQQLWLAWMQTLVTRWQSRAAIAAWEIFSEMDIASGSDEASATAFAEHAADAIRAADSYTRPVLASTSDLVEWTTLWTSRANDAVEIHPYESDLPDLILSRVADRLARTPKPVLIAESGLSAASPDGTTDSSSPNAPATLTRAIWAGLVSGSATARAFWWEDGYAVFFPATGQALVDHDANLEKPAAAFLGTTDFSAAAPVSAAFSANVTGGVLAQPGVVMGWVHDVNCATVFSDCTANLTGESVSFMVPNAAAAPASTWNVTLINPATGISLAPTANVVTASDGVVILNLPVFAQAIAFRLTLSGT